MLTKKTIAILICTLFCSSGAMALTNFPDPCISHAYMSGVTYETLALFCVPDGTGSAFTQAQIYNDGTTIDATITLVLMDAAGYVITHFPSEDMWLESADGGLVPCIAGTTADFNTDMNGETSWVSPLHAGGHSMSSCVVYINGMALCQSPFQMYFNSPDVNGDGVVNLADLNLFAVGFFYQFEFHFDFFPDGYLNLSDIGRFAASIGASCQ